MTKTKQIIGFNICPCGNKVKKRKGDDSRGRFCSKKCFYLYRNNKGLFEVGHKMIEGSQKGWFKNNGGFIDEKGYKRLSKNGKHIREHRKIFENYYKIKLTPKMVIHHIDKNRSNNKIENLQFFRHFQAHFRIHRFAIRNSLPLSLFKINYSEIYG